MRGWEDQRRLRNIFSDLPGLTVRAALVQIGKHKIDRSNWDWNEVNNNPFFAPDPAIVPVWEDYLDGIRKAGSSIGAVVEVIAEGVPAGREEGRAHLLRRRRHFR